MDNFKKQLFGYSMKEVENYFAELEDQHRTDLLQKESELSKINEKINELEIKNNNLAQELEALNEKKNDFINHMNSRIDKIEKFVNNKQAESDKIKQVALQELTKKRNELAKLQSSIKEFKKDLAYIKNRRMLNSELFRP
jgi:predicted RNase H-like nuclease (RuvC/YqgF family)